MDGVFEVFSYREVGTIRLVLACVDPVTSYGMSERLILGIHFICKSLSIETHLSSGVSTYSMRLYKIAAEIRKPFRFPLPTRKPKRSSGKPISETAPFLKTSVCSKPALFSCISEGKLPIVARSLLVFGRSLPACGEAVPQTQVGKTFESNWHQF